MTNVTRLKQRNTTARQEIAASVRSFIARAGVSKSAVAREVGMAQSTFSRRTTGAEPFDADELGTLADYFEVSLVDLIAGNVNKIAPNAKKAPTRMSGSQMVGPAGFDPTTSTVEDRRFVAPVIQLFKHTA